MDLSHLKTDLNNGLSTEEVAVNREKFGANVFKKTKKVSLFTQIVEAMKEPMVLLLLFAAFLALGINFYEYFVHKSANFLECVGIFIAIFLSVGITLIMERRSQRAFEMLNSITEGNQVRVMRNGAMACVVQDDIVVGDIIFLESGDKIPSDCAILEAQSLLCDESSLTGESMPSAKESLESLESLKKQDSGFLNTMLYRGCFVTQGSAKALCLAVGNQTEFGKIATELDSTQKTSTPLQEKLKRLSGNIAILGASAAVLAFFIQIGFFIFYGRADFENIAQAFISSVVLIVASVPEGLPTIVAISLALNIIKMSKQNALVKKLVACETIGCVNIICSDKTGTLTQNKMTLEHLYLHHQNVALNAPLDSTLKPFMQEFLQNCALNSTADLAQNGNFIGNPTECALLVFAKKSGFDYLDIRKNSKVLYCFPFSSQTKSMTTIIQNTQGVMCYVKGAPEKILSLCALDSTQNLKAIQEAIRFYQSKAYRVIAFAHKPLESLESLDFEKERNALELDLTFCGFVAIADPLRSDVYDAIKACKGAGIKIKILTGDNLETAQAIGHQLHLLNKDSIAIEANALENLNEKELFAILPKVKIIARSTPSTKMKIVNALKAQGNVVALTGDGINDAPALKNADVGIAMGISGTEATKEVSDIVLLNDSFATIVRAIEWGRGIYQNFQRFIQFQLAVNLSSVLIVLTAVLCGFTAPFSALQLLWVNLIMDGPPALTLGLEPISKKLLNAKPIQRNANIITKNMLILIVGSGLFIAGVCLLQYFVNFLNVAKEQEGTALFALFVIFQLFNAFNARELDNKSIFNDFLNNRLMLVVFVVTFILQVLIVEFGGEAFRTIPLEWILWVKILCVGFSVVVLGEIMRFYLRMKRIEK